MDENGSEPVAGPSRPRTIATGNGASSPSTIAIPSTGVEFFEYRRRLWLAGHELPSQPSTSHPPRQYTISLPLPEPLPSKPYYPSSSPSVERLETLLAEPGAEETDLAWRAGVGIVSKHLSGGKKLSKPLRLGLVIKILRAGWLRDGTWPTDPRTSRAIKPPDSPTSIRSFELSITALDSNEQILAEQNTTRQEQDDQVGRTEVTAWPWTNGVPAYGQANAGET